MVNYDIAVVGGGCVGISIANHLAEKSSYDICVLEKEYHLAQHQTGRNSGIIKPGFNFEPQSQKSKLTIEGTKRMKRFHQEHGLPMLESGVLIAATSDEEEAHLHDLHEMATANGVTTEILADRSEIRDHEPNAAGQAALFCPDAASVDSQKFLYTLATEAENNGVEFYMGHTVTGVSTTGSECRISTDKGTITASHLVNAAGVNADKIAHQLGVGQQYQIVPFRGEYYELTPDKADLVKSMIYPTPDPDLPFLGVHFTRRVDDKVILGPNAVLAFGREAYTNSQVNIKDLAGTLQWEGFRKLFQSKKMLNVAWDELQKSYRKSKFIENAQRLIPSLGEDDFVESYTGIRSQVVRRDGTLLKQPKVLSGQRSTHVIQTVWMTSSLPFGDGLSDEILSTLNK
jgi:(S)-2-hydroxyglutarate dehydrogenase